MQINSALDTEILYVGLKRITYYFLNVIHIHLICIDFSLSSKVCLSFIGFQIKDNTLIKFNLHNMCYASMNCNVFHNI